MSGTEPDEVEVGQDPGEPEGEAPADHDAEVGQRQHRHHRQQDGAHLMVGEHLFIMWKYFLSYCI